MRLLKRPWTRGFLVWSVVLLVAGILVALDAVIGLYQAQQACYFQVAQCPTAGDPDLSQLAFAFFGIPAIWLVGVLVGAVARAIATRRRAGRHPEGLV